MLGFSAASSSHRGTGHSVGAYKQAQNEKTYGTQRTCPCRRASLGVRFIEALAPSFPSDARIFNGSLSDLAQLVSLLVSFFGVAWKDGEGVTLASLRGGGATYLYLQGVALDTIRWKGRWQAPRTLEVYIQECAALTMLRGLSPHVLSRMEVFAEGANHLLKQSTHNLRRPMAGHSGISGHPCSALRYDMV